MLKTNKTMKIQHLNLIMASLFGFMLKELLPEYQLAASVPMESSYVFDTLSNTVELQKAASILTPPFHTEEEKELERWSFWYNQDYQLAAMIDKARALKGASVRAILAKDSTDGSPWMRVVYDDCSSGTCVIRNFGHLEPSKRNGTWYITPKMYPEAYKNALRNTIWTLRPRSELPYNVAAFVTEFYPIALEQERKFGIPWQLKLAQAGLESRWGESRLAKQHNQYFGIKATGWQGKKTAARDEGGKFFNFAAHASASESFEYHSRFLQMYDRYDGVFKYKPDSTYNYTYRVLAKDYWNKKRYKPVYHRIGGKRVQLLDGKVYKLTGLECAMIELSRAGYASDYEYSIGLTNAVNLFAEPTKSSK